MNTKFGEMLRTERTAAKKTLAQVAEAIGIKVPYLSDVELCRRKPFQTEQIVKIAELLRCNARPLILAAAEERGAVTISTKDPRLNGIAASLARSGERLAPEQIAQIEAILGGVEKDE